MSIVALSAFDLFYFGLVVVALLAVVTAVTMWCNPSPPAGEPPANWGSSADDLRWEDEAVDSVHKQLAEVRTTATAWGTAISSLLGVFTLVAFIKGPDTFTGVKGGEAKAAALLVLLAAVFAAVAVLLAALAAQGVPRHAALLDGWELRHQTGKRAQAAAVQLGWSRVLGVGAALIVLASIGLTWLAALRESESSSSTQKVLLVSSAGDVSCGTLVKHGSGLGLKQADGSIVAAAGSRQVVKVDACP